MTPLAARPLDAPPDRVAAYAHALTVVPPDVVAATLAALDATAGDPDRVRHLLDSLLVAARLQDNPAYVHAVTEADVADERGDRDPEDVAAFVARMRAKHGD